MDFYYASGTNRIGPIDEKEFGKLSRQGVIQANTLVWCPEMETWMPFGEVRQDLMPYLYTNSAHPFARLQENHENDPQVLIQKP